MAGFRNSKASFVGGASLSKRARQSLLLCPAFALSLSPLLTLSCMAQGVGGTTTPSAVNIGNDIRTSPSTTILPTDVVPLAGDLERNSFGENLQLRILQRLPSRLYFSSSIEVTGRWESNPFQFPTKRSLLRQLPAPAVMRTLSARDQASIYDIIGLTGRSQGVFRALPNVSGGWTLGPHTRLFTNYFMIRDQLSHSNRLNTVIHSYAVGLQQDVPVGTKGSLQFEFQGRELWQLHQQSVFDFLPGITFSYIVTPRMVAFVNGLIQMRGKAPFQAPKKEIDPFYTWGLLYQKNGWTFSGSTTFVQNFREPFRGNATIPKNNYVLISDFEVARRVMKEYPGLQAFVRAEPIWNFHGSQTPGLSGMDFRLFAGMRFAMAKPALTATLQNIREQLQETEPAPPTPSGKPSAQQQMISPAELVAHNPQPIHGFLEKDALSETCLNPDGTTTLIAEDADTEGTNGGAAQEIASESQSALASSPASAPGSSIASSIAESESASTVGSAKPAVRTLEMIANSNTIPESSKVAGDSTSSILNLNDSSSTISELPHPDMVMPADSSALHALLDDASDKTNSDSLRGRTDKIREMANKHEEAHKIAMLNAAPLMPQPQVKPLAPIKNLTAIPMASTKGTTTSHMLSGSLPTPSGARANTVIVPGSNKLALNSLVTQINSVQLGASDKKIEPLPIAASHDAHTAELAPRAIAAAKKNLQPVPVITKAVAAPNVVPTPVESKATVRELAQLKPITNFDSVLSNSNQIVDSAKSSANKTEKRIASNKDGSIPVSELKLDVIKKTVGDAKLAKTAELKPSLVAESKLPKAADVKPTLVAESKLSKEVETVKTLETTKPSTMEQAIARIASASIPAVNLPSNFSSTSNPAAKSGPTTSSPAVSRASAPAATAPRVRLEHAIPAVIPPSEEITAAVSGLSETEISSPKLAMASYESWQSPVIDDPLIEQEVRVYPGTATHSTGKNGAKKVNANKSASVTKNSADMKLIAPFPAIDGSDRQTVNGKSLDIKIPVIPVH